MGGQGHEDTPWPCPWQAQDVHHDPDFWLLPISGGLGWVVVCHDESVTDSSWILPSASLIQLYRLIAWGGWQSGLLDLLAVFLDFWWVHWNLEQKIVELDNATESWPSTKLSFKNAGQVLWLILWYFPHVFEHFLCVRHYSKCSAGIHRSNLHNSLLTSEKYVIFSMFQMKILRHNEGMKLSQIT